jgi:hypothetical protein
MTFFPGGSSEKVYIPIGLNFFWPDTWSSSSSSS